jgi:hypothetical protein
VPVEVLLALTSEDVETAACDHVPTWGTPTTLGPLTLTRMMPLRVSDAMQSAASLCSALAAQVDAGAPPIPGSPSQPSAAAIAAGHAAVEAAAAAMTVRLQATGTKGL